MPAEQPSQEALDRFDSRRFEYRTKGMARRRFDQVLAAFVDWPGEAFFLLQVDDSGETVLAEKLLNEKFARTYKGYHDIKESA